MALMHCLARTLMATVEVPAEIHRCCVATIPIFSTYAKCHCSANFFSFLVSVFGIVVDEAVLVNPRILNTRRESERCNPVRGASSRRTRCGTIVSF